MKIRVFALLLCVIVLSSAQVLETVIRLRYAPFYQYHIPESNKLYVLTNVWPDAQAFYIYVVDCNRQLVTGMIDTRNTEGGELQSVVLLPQYHKLYWGVWYGSSPDTPGLMVVDPRNDSVINRLPIGVEAMGYSPTSDRLVTTAYKDDWLCGDIFILDPGADTVVRKIEEYPLGRLIWWDSVSNKMFIPSGQLFARADWVMVLDCERGEVSRVLRTGLPAPTAGCHLPRHRKLYLESMTYRGVVVIDCDREEVIGRIEGICSLGDFEHGFYPVYCEQEDKVYFPSSVERPAGLMGDTLLIIDPKLDSIVGGIHLQPWVTRSLNYRAGTFMGMDYAPWSNRLYVVSCTAGQGVVRSFISVYDCATDSLIGLTTVDVFLMRLFCNPVDHKIYALCFPESAIYVFRDSLVGVEERGVVSLPAEAEPTLVRSILYLPERAGAAGKPVLVDITGRRVRELVPGANDVRGLTPGVYFVRSNAGMERKV
ncbi:MAG: hypothetical protein ABIK54_06820, partial [candidate division WOR-3 bacterium]